MNSIVCNKVKVCFFVLSAITLVAGCNSQEKVSKSDQGVDNSISNAVNPIAKKFNIQIILGSTRPGRVSDKIGTALTSIADNRVDIATEIIDLREYDLPFLNDEVAPASRKIITDPAIQKWSDKVKEADAFIIVVPVYNAGYPGVLKNALDVLYKEWNNKPVAFVGYSGGSSGGSSVVAQLREVVQELKMRPIAPEFDVYIPSSWKAVDKKGNLVDKSIDTKLHAIIDQLVQMQSRSEI